MIWCRAVHCSAGQCRGGWACGWGDGPEYSELARAKKLELGWLGLAWRQSQNPSLALLGLKQVLNFQAELGSCLKEMEIYELSSARGK